MTMFGVDLGQNELSEPLTLSALEFDVLWEHLRLEMMPLVIKVPSPGRTHTERRQLQQRVWADLEARGLGGPNSLDPRLTDLLRLLHRPEFEVDARIWSGRSVRVLAAASGRSGVLAVLTEDGLTLRPASSEGLPREAVSVLRPLAAGPGHSVTLPSRDLDAAAEGAATPELLEQHLRARGLREPDAHALAEMIRDAGDRGQFGAAARDRWGKRVRPDRVVAFFDTPRGRYVQMRRASAGSEPWSTIGPADQRRLVQHVTDLLTEAATPPR